MDRLTPPPKRQRVRLSAVLGSEVVKGIIADAVAELDAAPSLPADTHRRESMLRGLADNSAAIDDSTSIPAALPPPTVRPAWSDQPLDAFRPIA